MKRLVPLFVLFVLLLSFVPTKAATKLSFINPQGQYLVADGAAAKTVIGEVKAVGDGAISYRLLSGKGIAVDEKTGLLTVVTPPKVADGTAQLIKVAATNGAVTTEATFTVAVVPSAQAAKRGVTQHQWTNVSGDAVEDIKQNAPFTTKTVDHIDVEDLGDNYGLRYRGYIRPEVTGEYIFWLSSDDSSQFRLSTNATRAALSGQPLAFVDGWVDSAVWNQLPSQKSSTVQLVRGQLYYFELLFKEGAGGDHVSLAWQGPKMPAPINGDKKALVPKAQLIPADAIDIEAPAMPQYASIAKIDQTGVTIQWIADVKENATYTIARDGAKVAEVKGTKSLMSVLDKVTTGVHTYTIVARDDAGNVSPTATIANVEVKPYTALDQALATGNAAYIADATPILTDMLQQATKQQKLAQQFLSQLYGKQVKLAYTPEDWSHLLRPSAAADERVHTIIKATKCADGSCDDSLAVAGKTASGTRFAAFGGNPTVLALQSLTPRLISWLATGNAGAKAAGQRVAILNEEETAQSLKSWLVTKGIATKEAVTFCTVANAKSCFANATLIFVGSKFDDNAAPTIQTAVAEAVKRGTPIFYNNDRGFETNEVERALGATLGFAYSDMAYWKKPQAITSNATKQDRFAPVIRLLQHMKANNWNVNFSQCEELNCEKNKTATAYLEKEFYSGARDYFRAQLTSLDEEAQRLFATPPSELRLLKGAVLLGDVYRRSIQYPVSATTAKNSDFFTAYFADHVVYNTRSFNEAQADLGSFSKRLRADLPRYNKTLTFETRRGDYFRAAGVYALPGQTVTIERLDGGTNAVKVAINSLREGSTHEMDRYDRPKFLMTPWITLTKGKKVEVTSPYGGPVQLFIEQTMPTNNIQVDIQNVGQHPVWNGPASTAAFTEGLQAGDYDWAELLTPGFEVHATRQLMLQSLEDKAFNTPEKLATAAYNDFYLTNYTLGGFVGPGLQDSPTVAKLCQQNEWNCTDETLHSMPSMNHFNSDRPLCGYGCSGNPYDAWWAFSPIGWGDSHEMGHNLQWLNITNAKGEEVTGEVSNNIFPSHVVYEWNKNHPTDKRLHSTNMEQTKYYRILNEAQKTANPQVTMEKTLWGAEPEDNPFKVFFYVQLAQQAKNNRTVTFGDGGWDVVTMLYKGYRLKDYAQNDEQLWSEWAPRLGMANYSIDEARDMPPNDLLLIMLSKVTQSDEREFFKMWGVTFSDKAAKQVAALGYKAAAKDYYYFPVTSDGTVIWGVDSIGSVPVDGKPHTIPSEVRDGFTR